MRTLAAALLTAAAALAQTVTLPTPPPLATNTQLPFSAGVGRYQQWFSAQQAAEFGGQPIRIQSLQVLAGSSATLSASLDCEISMAHAPAFGLNSTFDSNYVTPPVLVRPRTTLALNAAPVGQPAMTVNFTQPFTWDGQSPVVVDVRVYGNSRGNQPFAFDLRSTAQGFGSTMRVYAGNNASATGGTLSNGQGLFLRFALREGAQIPFGNGCRSGNFVTPVASTQQIPSPGATWTHQISNAAAQTLAGLVIGSSRTVWAAPGGALALPLDLGPLLNAPGCYLLTDPAVTLWVFTVGSPGAASATLPLSMPPTTELIGASLFSQWVVLDPSAINGTMSATAGIWSIVAPLGG